MNKNMVVYLKSFTKRFLLRGRLRNVMKRQITMSHIEQVARLYEKEDPPEVTMEEVHRRMQQRQAMFEETKMRYITYQ